MMKFFSVFLICCSSVWATYGHATLAANAKLSLNKNNIKVWTYQDPKNSAMSYTAETTLNVPMERAVALILDVKSTATWIPNVAHAELLSQPSSNGEFNLYMILDFPFPLKDRDLVVKGSVKKDAQGVIHIQNRAVTQGKAIDAKYTRITRYEGNWRFEKIDANQVKVTTSGFADPAGSIPASVANFFVEQQPYQMLQKMKAELAKNKPLPALPAALR